MTQAPKNQNPPSPLRRVFNLAEQAVAERVEPLVQTGGFATVMSRYVSINRRVGKTLSKVTGGVLHLVNIPTTADVARLHEHLNAVDKQVSQIARGLDSQSASRMTTPHGSDPSHQTTETPQDREQTSEED